MKKLVAALVSSQSAFCDVTRNLCHFESLIRKAKQNGARLVCFPELAATGYFMSPLLLEHAERIPGRMTAWIERIAARHNVYISMGMPERSGNVYYISQVLAGPSRLAGMYRKRHLTEREKDCGFSAGDDIPVFRVDDFLMGISICADGRRADTLEAMRLARVDIIHHPHGNGLSLGRDAEEWTRVKMSYYVKGANRPRAYVLINNSAGDTEHPGGRYSFGSGALVVNPEGQLLSRTVQRSRSEKMLIATLVKPHVPVKSADSMSPAVFS